MKSFPLPFPTLFAGKAPGAACALALAFAILSSGCASGEGSPFATADMTLSATMEFHEEDMDADGWLVLENGGLLKVEKALLSVDQVRIMSLPAQSGGSAFDPADPPEGYSLCHGGHCHADDGSLVPYADIEASLLGGGASVSTALAASFDGPVDLMKPEAVRPICPEDARGECALGEGRMERLELAASALEIAGKYKADASADASDVAVTLLLDPAASGLFTHGLDFTSSRTGSDTLRLDMVLNISCDVLGELDWPDADASSLEGFQHEFSESGFLLGDEEHAEHGHDHEHEHEHGDDHDADHEGGHEGGEAAHG